MRHSKYMKNPLGFSRKNLIALLFMAGVLALYSAAISQWVIAGSVVIAAGFLAVMLRDLMGMEKDLLATHQALGAFMRGMMDERISVRAPHSRFGILQHRMNNILDVIDYDLRGNEAGFDTNPQSEYLQKITSTGFYAFCNQRRTPPVRMTPEVIALPAPMPSAFHPDVEPIMLQEDLVQKLISMRQALLHMQSVAMDASEKSYAMYAPVANHLHAIRDAIISVAEKLNHSAQASVDVNAQIHQSSLILRNLLHTTADIEQVIEMIQEVAGQTDMLALNATIEAARASEAGRGFSVVACEVKNLAMQTSKASALVKEKMAQMQAISHDAMAAMEHIARSMAYAGEEAEWAKLLQQQPAMIAEISEQIDRLAQQATSGFLPPQTLELLLELASSMLKDASVPLVNISEEAPEYALAS